MKSLFSRPWYVGLLGVVVVVLMAVVWTENHREATAESGGAAGVTEVAEESLEGVVCRVFAAIPDHCDITPEVHELMTASLYDAIHSAWEAIPEDQEGIGDEEFLFYFLTGNGGDEVDRASVRLLSTEPGEGGSIVATVAYDTRWEDKTPSTTDTLTLTLVCEQGTWLLDDFDGVKARCMGYIASQK